MNEQQLRALLSAIYDWCDTVEDEEDFWNLGGQFVGVAHRTLTEEPAKSWFTAWKAGRSYTPDPLQKE